MRKVSDEQFIETWHRLQSAVRVSEELNIDVRAVHQRRRSIEKKIGELLPVIAKNSPSFHRREHKQRTDLIMEEGVIVVGSDAHYWPGVVSTAHKAFVKTIKDLKPEVVCLNGDVFDGASISRFPKAGWESRPTVKQEMEAVSDRLDEIENASKNSKFVWTLGNHDARFESRLANAAPEYEGVPGFALVDHWPRWMQCMSLMVNDNLMIKHRFRNGQHATWNNTLFGGLNICTGHLHRLQATIFSDYRGTRWGVDCGTLAEVDGEHMGYGEDNPMNHCSGFAVLTIVDGKMIHPEFCSVVDGRAYFRGKQIV